MSLFNLFKRKKVEEKANPSFKQNVSDFWDWYAQNAQRFYNAIEAGNSSSLVKDVSAAVDKWLPDMAWVFGPGPNQMGHSFTLSPEGDHHRQLLTAYWLKAAPALDGWTFHSSRQANPSKLSSQIIKIRDEVFKPEAFWVTPQVDDENERVNITAWHPLFEKLPEPQRYEILFLWLDEILGERGTTDFLGKIELNNGQLKNAFPILELGSFISNLRIEKSWESHEPGSLFVTYKMSAQEADFLRADTIAGTTSHNQIISDYFAAEGNMKDPIAGTGAAFVFIAFDRDFLPEGNEANARGDLEDLLVEALESEKSGICLGGAQGLRMTYIDLLIFDGHRSIELIASTLASQKLPRGSAIYPFAGSADTPLHVF